MTVPVGPNTGFTLAGTVMAPFGGFASQPAPFGPPITLFVGGGGGVALPGAVRAQYNDAWDIDAEDQMQFTIPAKPGIRAVSSMT